MIYGYGYVLLTYDFMEPSGADKLKKVPLAHRTSKKEFTCSVENLACPVFFFFFKIKKKPSLHTAFPKIWMSCINKGCRNQSCLQARSVDPD